MLKSQKRKIDVKYDVTCCDKCDSIFTSTLSLLNHIKEEHENLTSTESKLKSELEKNKKLNFDITKMRFQLKKVKQNHAETRSEMKNMKTDLQIDIQALEEEKDELKKDLIDLQTEIDTKNNRIQSLEFSEIETQKIKNFLATKIFLNDSTNENLQSLLNLEMSELFTKYEMIVTGNEAKLQEIIETLADVRTKLNLQAYKREAYEKQHTEIMTILNIPEKNQCFANILPAINSLKESNSEMNDQIEAQLYENAEIAITSNSSALDKTL